MLYLNVYEFGFDAQSLGFPSVLGCNAIVLVTDKGLYGFHNCGGGVRHPTVSPDSDVFVERAKAFASFASSAKPPVSEKSHLFSVCSRSTTNHRGYDPANPVGDWEEELTAFAQALKFKGTVHGFDMDKVPSWPNALHKTTASRDAAYVVFTKMPKGCKIEVAPSDRVTYATAPPQTSSNHRVLDPKTSSVLALTNKIVVNTTIGAFPLRPVPTAAEPFETFKV